MRKWRNGIMILCLGILCFAMVSIVTRVITSRFVIERLRINNGITAFITQDMASEFNEKTTKKISINWVEMYPFTDSTADKQSNNVFQHLMTKQSVIKNIAEKKVDSWATNRLAGYGYWVETGRSVEDMLGWKIVNPRMNLAKTSDGMLYFVNQKCDVREKAESVAQLAAEAKGNGAQFLYVQTPYKISAYGDTAIRDHLDHTNEAIDDMLGYLRDKGIDTLDLRDQWRDLSDEEYHQLFYRTDHHWRPETALQSAGVVAAYMKEHYGLQADLSHFSQDDYDWQMKEKWFLGSQGKKATLARTYPDDFSWGVPNYPTKIHLEIPTLGIDQSGDFSLMLNMSQVEEYSPYHAVPYDMFLYSDGFNAFTRIENLALSQCDGQKVLAFTDSYGDPFIPFLSMGVKEIVKVDLRLFNGSVEKLIEQEQPGIVILLYSAGYNGRINWDSHLDLYDFR